MRFLVGNHKVVPLKQRLNRIAVNAAAVVRVQRIKRLCNQEAGFGQMLSNLFSLNLNSEHSSNRIPEG
jgi:hypothetical protein